MIGVILKLQRSVALYKKALEDPTTPEDLKEKIAVWLDGHEEAIKILKQHVYGTTNNFFCDECGKPNASGENKPQSDGRTDERKSQNIDLNDPIFD